jgi:L-amino acid N-acyltransferase YncA
MKILPATPGDEEGIATAHVSAWQTAYRGIVSDTFLDALNVPERANSWAGVLRDSSCKVLVAKESDQLLGFVSFGKYREENAAPMSGEVWTMYVHPSSWRAGVGRALLNNALTDLERSGFATVWVWVLQANPQAIAFYTSCGFMLQRNSQRMFQLRGQELAEVALVRNAA